MTCLSRLSNSRHFGGDVSRVPQTALTMGVGTVMDAKEVVILKDIYELLERAIDHCRDAGKVVFQIALKYA